MSVGGRLIEIAQVYDAISDDELCRLWVVDRNGDETCVYAEVAEVMPALGEEIWWQAGKVYFQGDRRHLIKVGASFRAPVAEDW